VPELSPFKPQALSGDITFRPVMFTVGPDPDEEIDELNESATARMMITNTTKTMSPITPPGERLPHELGSDSLMMTVDGLG